MFQHLTRHTGLMGMENGHGLVVELSAEQFFKQRSSFRACYLLAHIWSGQQVLEKGWKRTQSSSIAKSRTFGRQGLPIHTGH